MKLIQRISREVGRLKRLNRREFFFGDEKDHERMIQSCEEDLEELEAHLPHGSGFDSGTKIDLESSEENKIVLYTSYHHMKDGFYDGWTEHTITVLPTFTGFELRISGRNRNDIKEYLYQIFYDILSEEVKETERKEQAQN